MLSVSSWKSHREGKILVMKYSKNAGKKEEKEKERDGKGGEERGGKSKRKGKEEERMREGKMRGGERRGGEEEEIKKSLKLMSVCFDFLPPLQLCLVSSVDFKLNSVTG